VAVYPSPYLTQQNLTDAWGAEAMLQLFDDANTHTVNAAAVAMVIGRAQAQTSSWLPDTYDGVVPFTSPIPEMIVELCFAYARFYAYPRNPDYFRALGEKRLDLLAEAETLGKQLQAAIKRLVDAPSPEDNLGGEVDSNDPNRDFVPRPLVFIRSMGYF
jgi:phage gp36-like protein